MSRLIFSTSVAAFIFWATAVSTLQGQTSEIVSEHIRLGIPLERQWLGRDVISDLERFWKFANGALGDNMPRRVAVAVRWDLSATTISAPDNGIVLGMDQPATGPDLRASLFRQAARELARLGLMKLARQQVPVERTEFLMQGMSEILLHEFDRSTRVLDATWTIAKLLDRAGLLGFQQQADWAGYAQGRHNLNTAAPGVTFLMACRDAYGRESTFKLFQALRAGNLDTAFGSAFKSNAAALESAWLKRVREQSAGEDATVSSEEDAPVLEQTTVMPGVSRPGQTVEFHIFLRDRTNDLPYESVFLQDSGSGKVRRGRKGPNGSAYFEVPIETDRRPGRYAYRITAVDDSGNVRNWEGAYEVSPPADAGSSPSDPR